MILDLLYVGKENHAMKWAKMVRRVTGGQHELMTIPYDNEFAKQFDIKEPTVICQTPEGDIYSFTEDITPNGMSDLLVEGKKNFKAGTPYSLAVEHEKDNGKTPEPIKQMKKITTKPIFWIGVIAAILIIFRYNKLYG